MSVSLDSAVALAQHVRQGDFSARDVVERTLTRIHEADPPIQAFLPLDEALAYEAAESVDAKRHRGETLGCLAGVPIAVKDNICQQGIPTTCASRMLASFRPPYDATVIEKLRQADAVLIGRTNLDEFAMGSSCENSAVQCTRNPHDPTRTPGGSSGGSAAAVAGGMTPLAIGSDTGGSIRQPAAFCGVVGVKPTYGRVSRSGLIAFASSLDQIGPFATNVTDAALLLEVLSGHDAKDSTSVNLPVPQYSQELEQPLKGLRLGIVPEHFSEGLDPEINQRIQEVLGVYREQGATVVEVPLPHARYCVATYYIIAPSEASSNLARYDGVHFGYRTENFDNMVDMYERSRGEAFGDEVKRRIMIGTYALSSGYYDAYYLKALKVRRLIQRDYLDAFQQVDLLLTPVTPTLPFKLGELSEDPLAMYLSDLYTIGANLAGIPGVSVPCGFSRSGLPIGFQLLAPAFEESRMLRAARMYEQSAVR